MKRRIKFRIWNPDKDRFEQGCSINSDGEVEDSIGKVRSHWIIQIVEEYDELAALRSICNQIYIARNITLSESSIIDALEKIDRWGREENKN